MKCKDQGPESRLAPLGDVCASDADRVLTEAKSKACCNDWRGRSRMTPNKTEAIATAAGRTRPFRPNRADMSCWGEFG